jgi:hypothetical protein
MKTKNQPTVSAQHTPKFIFNPEYDGSESQREEAMAHSFGLDDYYSFMPDECGAKIPKEGCWIMVKRPPHTEYTVPPFSMWYAFEELRPKGLKGDSGLAYHLARILTPKGDLYLYPHEYVCVKDVSKYFEFPEDHIHINGLGGEPANPDAMFYIRSRGISKKEAIKMLIGDVKSQNVVYVTVHPAYGRMFCRDIPDPARLAFTEEWAGE